MSHQPQSQPASPRAVIKEEDGAGSKDDSEEQVEMPTQVLGGGTKERAGDGDKKPKEEEGERGETEKLWEDAEKIWGDTENLWEDIESVWRDIENVWGDTENGSSSEDNKGSLPSSEPENQGR